VRKKDFIRIINEEISKFDFLSNEQHLREEEIYELLENEQFQKQFIVDAITNFKEKINLDNNAAYMTNDPNFDDALYRDDEFIEYPARIIYEYNKEKEPIVFEIQFNGNKIDLNEVNVNMYSKDGDDIDFIAFKKAPKKIQELFIETFVKPIINNQGEGRHVDEKPQFTSI
jgi:hypothetical protein